MCLLVWCTLYPSVLGVLLRKMESGLVGVSHVIVDEIHERDLNVCQTKNILLVNYNPFTD